jgi:hypothetical protein
MLEAEAADKKALVEWNRRRVATRNERFDVPGESTVDEPQRLLLAQQAFFVDAAAQHEADHAEVAGLFGLLEASGWELEQDLADKKRASELNSQVRLTALAHVFTRTSSPCVCVKQSMPYHRALRYVWACSSCIMQSIPRVHHRSSVRLSYCAPVCARAS